MNFSFYISRRYFISKKKKNFINFIAIISMGSLAVASAAMVIVLSGFNGMEGFLKNLFVSFDPDLRIVPREGKTFVMDAAQLKKIQGLSQVNFVTPVLEEKVLLRYKEKKTIAKIKGVGDHFFEQNGLLKKMVAGKGVLREDSINYAIVGDGIRYKLGVAISDGFFPIQVIFPKRTNSMSAIPENAFIQTLIKPSGVFALEKQYDEQYVFVPLAFAQEAVSAHGKLSSIEIALKDDGATQMIKDQLKELFGEKFKVLDRDEQNIVQLRVLKTEKLIAFFILTVIILVASMNIFLCLTMLVIEKKHDLAVLKSLGASEPLITRIFMFEGLIMSIIGGVLGIGLGLLICYIQIKFQIARLGTETSLLDAYPIKVEVMDLLVTLGVIVLITILASLLPSRKAGKVSIKDYL